MARLDEPRSYSTRSPRQAQPDEVNNAMSVRVLWNRMHSQRADRLFSSEEEAKVAIKTVFADARFDETWNEPDRKHVVRYKNAKMHEKGERYMSVAVILEVQAGGKGGRFFHDASVRRRESESGSPLPREKRRSPEVD